MRTRWRERLSLSSPWRDESTTSDSALPAINRLMYCRVVRFSGIRWVIFSVVKEAVPIPNTQASIAISVSPHEANDFPDLSKDRRTLSPWQRLAYRTATVLRRHI